jgi:hypothetical protein
MPFEGDIKDFSLAEVAQIMGQGRKTGTLAVEGERETIWIYFKDGRAVFATPSNQREQLGALLVKDGYINPSQLELALQTQKKMRVEGNPIRLGTILLAMGAVERATLVEKITHQICESVYAAIGERKGHFRFFPELNLEDEDVLVSLDVEQIILEGSRRIQEWEEINDVIHSYHAIFAINPNPVAGGSIKLSPQAWRVLSMLDGRRNIGAIADASSLNRLDVCRILYALLRMNIIRQVPEGAAVADAGTRGK